MKSLEFTGERMMPEFSDRNTFWEHIYRYRFAARFVRNRRVLDIASGDGYGSASLRKAGARSVVGIDISIDACEYSRQKYGDDVMVADAQHIPFPNNSFDTIVSFETIEHLKDPQGFLKECGRVLSDNGLLVLSTPNREIFRERTGINPFHLSELSMGELTEFLKPIYSSWKVYSQVPQAISRWNIRGLLMGDSDWRKVRGGWRTWQFLLRTQCPLLLENIDDIRQQSPVALINMKDGPLGFMVNPFAVWSFVADENPQYLVVVARRS